MKRRIILALVLFTPLLFLAGCGIIAGDQKIDEGVVIAPKLKIRSSTAMVALDLAEVKRGDRLEILEQAEVKTPTRVEEWYKVRTPDEKVVGWVEARYLINKEVVEKINQLFAQSKQTPSQGSGRLKVQTRLRIEPGGDVVTHLSRGTPVEIVGKARTTVKPEKQQTGEDAEEEATEEPEARTVLWYQVRLPEGEVLHAGWVGAQQVQLDVPDEILHLEGDGRRFTGWITYDQVKNRKGEIKNNFIGLMKSLGVEGPIDFTRIWVLTYSPEQGRYNGSYIEDGLRGVLPVTLGTSSGGKGFTIHELDESGKAVPVEYEMKRIDASRVQVRRITPKLQIKRQPRRSR